MSDILCVTNRNLCEEDFFLRMETIAKNHPAGIILREKDLSPKDYGNLAAKVAAICQKYQVPCIYHSFVDIAIRQQAEAIHLPLPILENMSDTEKAHFEVIGASCHSAEDAVKAQNLGCTYITAGHIFDTDCKKGLPGRGLDFLKQVCQSVTIPVYAIGGITSENFQNVQNAGAKGACVMSGLMQCTDAASYMKQFNK